MLKVNPQVRKYTLLLSLLAEPLLAQAQAVPVELAPSMAAARTHFRRHQYQAALLSLASKDDEQSLMIAAESSFRLGDYALAKVYYLKLQELISDIADKKKVAVRLFDIELLSGDVDQARALYEAYQEKQKPPAMASYGLGKALFDRGDEIEAQIILGNIAPGSEFYLAARYILAVIDMANKKPSELVKLFKEIEQIPIITVEDHAIHDLAILAQGRLLIDAGREDLAETALLRIASHSAYYSTAIYELSSGFISRAERARLGLGAFSSYPSANKKIEEEKSLAKASELISRFRKTGKIDGQEPELLAVMADLLAQAKRYDEARLVYDELFTRYTLTREEINQAELWHELSLDGNKAASSFVQSAEVRELLEFKNRLHESRKKLYELKEQGGQKHQLEQAHAKQKELENIYFEIAKAKQAELLGPVLARFNQQVAEAEYKRAQLVLQEMRDVKKQLGVAQEFQTQKIELFESSLKAIDKGGAQ